MLRSAWAFWFLAANWPGTHVQDPRSAVLRLGVANSIRLPSSQEIAGADISNDGAVLYWFRTGPPVLRSGHDSVALCTGRIRDPVAAAFVGSSSRVEILDSNPDGGSVRVLFAGSGRCGVARHVRTIGSAFRAARAGAGWIIAVRRAGGNASYTFIGSGPFLSWRLPADSANGSPTNPLNSSVAGSGTMFVLSSMRWPYRTAVVSGTGVVLREFQMSQGVPLDTDYIALGAIPVPGGFLQTMVDPRSDRRRLVLMDSLGTVLSLTEIETAFGAVASSPNGRFVLALRRTDYIELVTYKVLGSAERGR